MKSMLIFLLLPAIIIAQIPNESFENWHPAGTVEDPDFWSTNNYGFYDCVAKTTDSYMGMYALNIESNYPTFEGHYPGTASIFLSFSEYPTVFSSYVKCDSLADDGSCKIRVYAFYGFYSEQIALWESYENIPAYTKIDVPLDIIGSPDSIQIVLEANPNVTAIGGFGYARMKVDEATIDGTIIPDTTDTPADTTVDTTIHIPDLLIDQIMIYPNPAKDIIFLKHHSGIIQKIIIYDLFGKKQDEIDILDSSSSVNISKLPPGIYVFKLIDIENNFIFYKVEKIE